MKIDYESIICMKLFPFSFIRDDNFIMAIQIAFDPTVSLSKIVLYPVFEAKCKFFNQWPWHIQRIKNREMLRVQIGCAFRFTPLVVYNERIQIFYTYIKLSTRWTLNLCIHIGYTMIITCHIIFFIKFVLIIIFSFSRL